MTISWYPGHMAKARRLLEAQLSRAELIIEVCDARIPLSSRNPELSEMALPAHRLVVLNKSDLAEPGATARWLRHLRQSGEQAVAVTSLKSASPVLTVLGKLAAEKESRDRGRGIRRTMRAIVVGVPNTGKSSLINRLSGAAVRTENRPGVTRANQWIKVSPYMELMDSPGMLWPRLDDQEAARRLAYVASIRDEVTDRYLLAQSLAEELMVLAAEVFMERFRVSDPSLRGQLLMEAVCAGRGFLLRQGKPDFERAAAAVLEEFRSGLIGRITLEHPQAETPVHSDESAPCDA